MELVKYKKKAIFVQKFKVSDVTKPISGYLEFMTCDATKCLPPATIDFSFDLTKALVAYDIKYDRGTLCDGLQSFAAVATEAKKKIEQTKSKGDNLAQRLRKK